MKSYSFVNDLEKAYDDDEVNNESYRDYTLINLHPYTIEKEIQNNNFRRDAMIKIDEESENGDEIDAVVFEKCGKFDLNEYSKGFQEITSLKQQYDERLDELYRKKSLIESLMYENEKLEALNEKTKSVQSLNEQFELKQTITYQQVVPASENDNHVLELFQIKSDFRMYVPGSENTKLIDSFRYGYFCSEIRERTDSKIKPEADYEPFEIFSIQLPNTINIYHYFKDYLKKYYNRKDFKIIGNRFYCNIQPSEIVEIFATIVQKPINMRVMKM